MKKQVTFSYIKKDALKHVQEIKQDLEQKGFQIIHSKWYKFNEETAKEFYKEHDGKSFFEGLWKFTSSNEVYAIILAHETSTDIITDFRKTIGATNPNNAEPDTIRAKYADKESFAKGMPTNAIHGSDSHQSAIREISIVFPEVDIAEYV